MTHPIESQQQGDLWAKFLPGPANWENRLAIARYHGVLPMLYWYVQHLPDDGSASAAPAAATAEMRRAFHANGARYLMMSSELVRVHDALAQRGVRSLVVKGPGIAAQVYPAPALREHGDLDLLIEPACYGLAVEALEALGYQAWAPKRMSPRREQAWARFTFERHFSNLDHQADVDLHWGLFDHAVLPFDFSALWERRETAAIYGGKIAVPGAEDHLLYLCAHGAKHAWESLKWLVDVAELLKARAPLDWTLLWGQAGALNAQRMLGLGVGLAHRLLDAPLPAAVQEAIGADPALVARIETTGARLLRSLEAPADGVNSAGRGPARRRRLAPWPDTETLDRRYGLATTWTNLRLVRLQQLPAWRRMALSLRIVLTPGAKEIRLADLPPRWHALYYLLRVWRVSVGILAALIGR